MLTVITLSASFLDLCSSNSNVRNHHLLLSRRKFNSEKQRIAQLPFLSTNDEVSKYLLYYFASRLIATGVTSHIFKKICLVSPRLDLTVGFFLILSVLSFTFSLSHVVLVKDLCCSFVRTFPVQVSWVQL